MVTAKSSIKQGNAARKKPLNYLNTKFDIYNVRCLPDVGGLYYNEFRQRVDEIKNHSGSILNSATKAFSALLFSKAEKQEQAKSFARRSGLDIVDFEPSQSNTEIVEQLGKNPLQHRQRVTLATKVHNSVKSLPVEQMRQVLMQISVPMGFGEFDVGNMKLLASGNRRYKAKLLILFHHEKQKIMRATGGSSYEQDPHFQCLLRNEQLLKKLMERSIDKIQTADFVISLNLSTITKVLDGTLNIPKGTSMEDKRRSLERNLAGIVMTLMEVEFLHPELIRIIEQYMRPLNPASPLSHYVEACLWSNQLKIQTIHEEFASGKTESLNAIESNMIQEEFSKANIEKVMRGLLKNCLTAYATSLKLLPNLSNMKQMQKKILIEHAKMCLYAYSLKMQLKASDAVIKSIILSGSKSLRKAEYTPENDKMNLISNYKIILEDFGMPSPF
ncbi:hypothetical protein WDW89_14190 [Deltaproteobacteria bacterium TL4]